MIAWLNSFDLRHGKDREIQGMLQIVAFYHELDLEKSFIDQLTREDRAPQNWLAQGCYANQLCKLSHFQFNVHSNWRLHFEASDFRGFDFGNHHMGNDPCHENR